MTKPHPEQETREGKKFSSKQGLPTIASTHFCLHFPPRVLNIRIFFKADAMIIDSLFSFYDTKHPYFQRDANVIQANQKNDTLSHLY
jgi:hypothetical protein